MLNETKERNIVAMLKETANFCRDAKQIFTELSELIVNDKFIKKVNNPINENFFFSKEGWIDYNFFVKINQTINGFRLIVATGEVDEYERYLQITNKLHLDKNIPLLLVYGCFVPVKNIEMSIKSTPFIVDACCGFTSKDDEEYDWGNFDTNQIEWNTDIVVEMKEWTAEIATLKGYPEWEEYCSKAKIKYKPLLEIQNYEDVKKLADEIKAMTIS